MNKTRAVILFAFGIVIGYCPWLLFGLVPLVVLAATPQALREVWALVGRFRQPMPEAAPPPRVYNMYDRQPRTSMPVPSGAGTTRRFVSEADDFEVDDMTPLSRVPPQFRTEIVHDRHVKPPVQQAGQQATTRSVARTTPVKSYPAAAQKPARAADEARITPRRYDRPAPTWGNAKPTPAAATTVSRSPVMATEELIYVDLE